MGPFLLFLSILLFTTTASFSSPLPIRTDYEVSLLYQGWLVKHNKSYNNDLSEKEKRYKIFTENLKVIDMHNAGNHTYTLALNVFADLTVEEYRATYLRTLPSRKVRKMEYDSYVYNDTTVHVAPDSIDWRDRGAINPVRDEGRCYCSWAFAVLTTVEAINQIVTGDLVSLSEQQLVDCFNKGCQPRSVVDAYQYIIDNGGIDTEEDYPYKAIYSGHCDKFKQNTKVVSIDEHRMVRRNNENALKLAVARQPVVSAVQARGVDFQFYKNGIFTGICGRDVDHAVVVIGYGSEGGKDYWIVRNSWGDEWGDFGYMKLERNIQLRSGKCGIAIWPYYPIKYDNLNKDNSLEGKAPVDKGKKIK